jgi:hypothetical protein
MYKSRGMSVIERAAVRKTRSPHAQVAWRTRVSARRAPPPVPGHRTMSRIPAPSSSRARPGTTTASTRVPAIARATSTPATPTRAAGTGTGTRPATTSTRAPAPPRLATSASVPRRPGTVSPAKSGGRSPARSPLKSPAALPVEPPRSPAKLSVREQIALKRAEAKKTTLAVPSGDGGLGPDSVPGPLTPVEEDDPLGRLPLREVIERAKSSGGLSTVDVCCNILMLG